MKRRDVIKKSLIGGSALLAGCTNKEESSGPAVHTKKKIRWRLASSFPSSLDTLYGSAVVLADKVREMTGGNFDTTYRARALLESMTAVVRRSPLFRDIKPETLLNSLDLFKMLGFKKIVVSDGDKFSYQVVLK